MKNLAPDVRVSCTQIEDQKNFELKNDLNIFVIMSTILLYAHEKKF